MRPAGFHPIGRDCPRHGGEVELCHGASNVSECGSPRRWRIRGRAPRWNRAAEAPPWQGSMVFRLLSGREAWQLLAQLFAQCRLIAESYIIRVRGVGSTASILPRSRRAVSCFSIQIGRRMSTTWPAVCGSLPITGKGIGGEGRSPLLPMHGIAPTGRMSVAIFVNTPGEGLDPNRRSLPGELHSFLRGNGINLLAERLAYSITLCTGLRERHVAGRSKGMPSRLAVKVYL